ncbi:MAG: ECF transporter S component [Oscillospiraceae bacterium]|jgi:uncharacterized membrane protein|nr:ECF transporter S component [Oscillospiraceae bacterium]
MRRDTSRLVRDLTATAVMAALIFAVTWSVRIPLPFTSGGYLNLGDAVIYASVCMIGGRRTAAAAAVGSGLADLMAGAVVYILPTAIIKGVMGFVVGALAPRNSGFPRYLTACLIGGAVMMGGYSLFELAYFGPAYALAALPFNAIQWAGGVVIAAACHPSVRRAATYASKLLDKG